MTQFHRPISENCFDHNLSCLFVSYIVFDIEIIMILALLISGSNTI